MKIITVAHNYDQVANSNHSPIIHLKPESALLKDGKPFFVPDFMGDLHAECEVVVRISRLGKNIARRFAHRYYQELTVGVDFTDNNLLRSLRKNGMPWDIAKGFDGSAVVGQFVPKTELLNEHGDINFSLLVNGQSVQSGNTARMLRSIDEIIEYVSRFYVLKIGDLIFTSSPSSTAVSIGNRLEGFAGNKKLLDFHVR